MKQINKGKIEGEIYRKKTSFNKAVLWKTKELSLPVDVFVAIKRSDVKKLIFEDESKNERWIFQATKVVENAKLKCVGQEPQYYFHIDLMTRKEEIVAIEERDPDEGKEDSFIANNKDPEEQPKLFELPINQRKFN